MATRKAPAVRLCGYCRIEPVHVDVRPTMYCVRCSNRLHEIAAQAESDTVLAREIGRALDVLTRPA